MLPLSVGDFATPPIWQQFIAGGAVASFAGVSTKLLIDNFALNYD